MEPLTVTELTRRIRLTVESNFRQVCVVGEISNCSRAGSGHVYLTLKDAQAQVSAVLWRTTAEQIVFDLHDGLEVIATGPVTVYPPRGQYQLTIETLQPKGVGALELKFRQLREKLAAEGLFDPRRKRPLPRYPGTIAIVTSPVGAAIRDILQVLVRRWPAARVIVVPVPVQGIGAGVEIAAGLRAAGQIPGLDVIITGRGGGSLEDLWSFNEECVARAIAASPIPVVSAVGHETDVTIADLVADVRALTPSEAAERVVPSAEETRDELLRLARRMSGALRSQATLSRARLDALCGRPVLCNPREWLRDRSRLLDEFDTRLRHGLVRQITKDKATVGTLAASLDALSPLRVLHRGYTVTRQVDTGAVLRSADQVRDGDWIETLLADGRIRSQVSAANTASGGR